MYEIRRCEIEKCSVWFSWQLRQLKHAGFIFQTAAELLKAGPVASKINRGLLMSNQINDDTLGPGRLHILR